LLIYFLLKAAGGHRRPFCFSTRDTIRRRIPDNAGQNILPQLPRSRFPDPSDGPVAQAKFSGKPFIANRVLVTIQPKAALDHALFAPVEAV
jgi:hypothetical protein